MDPNRYVSILYYKAVLIKLNRIVRRYLCSKWSSPEAVLWPVPGAKSFEH